MVNVVILTRPTCTAPTAVFNAVPNSGYRFAHWSNGTNTNPYSLTVTQDTALVAFFVSTEGIGDISADGVKVYSLDDRIMVEGAEGEKVQVFDMVGRPVGTQSMPTGVYMVTVGLNPARKVVIR